MLCMDQLLAISPDLGLGIAGGARQDRGPLPAGMERIRMPPQKIEAAPFALRAFRQNQARAHRGKSTGAPGLHHEPISDQGDDAASR